MCGQKIITQRLEVWVVKGEIRLKSGERRKTQVPGGGAMGAESLGLCLDMKMDIREASDRGNCGPMAPQGSCVCDRKLLTFNLGKVTVGHIKDDIQCQGQQPTPRVTSNAKLRVGLI